MTKVYIEFVASTPVAPTDATWDRIFIATRTEPLAAAITAAVRQSNNKIEWKINQATDAGRRALVSFEIDSRDRTALLDVLDVEAIVHGVTGTNAEKFEGVILEEVRNGARSEDFSEAQVAQLTTTFVSINNDRDTADAAAKAHIETGVNDARWHE